MFASKASILCVALVLFSLPLVAQSDKPGETSQTPAPVPSQITSAKKVFISNAGLDSASVRAFQAAGEPNGHYGRFYNAMKSWGRYDLVSAPSDAELVFEISFQSPLDVQQTRDPNFKLNILDARTHFVLWSLSQPVEGAFRKATFEKNLDKGMESLIGSLKILAGLPAPSTK